MADEGPVAVSVSLVEGVNSKAAVNPSEGTTVKLNRDNIKVKLTATSGGDDDWAALAFDEDVNTLAKTYYNVNNPTLFAVSVNGATAAASGLTAYYAAPAEGAGDKDNLGTPKAPDMIPLYATTNAFTPSGEVATDPDTQLSYNLYKASVNVEIPIARLEFSDIKHEAHDGGAGDECWFASISFDKIELFEDENYETLLVDEITNVADFMTGSYPAVAGEQAQCYAFNILPGMPYVRLAFTTTSEEDAEEEIMYAFITSFKNGEGEAISSFEKGKIYKISDMTITDENLTPDPTGNQTIAVEVTVTVQDWTVVDGITAEFK